MLGEAVVERSVCGAFEQVIPGSFLATASWDFLVTVKWRSIIHMLAKNLDLNKFQWKEVLASSIGQIKTATINKIVLHHERVKEANQAPLHSLPVS